MPHVQIDYSANLEERIDVPGLCAALRDAALATGLFPLAGIRVRATACTHAVIADGDPAHAFLDVSVRLRGGRPLEARKRAAEAMFAVLRAHCGEAGSLALSLEMRDIDPELSPKSSTIREHLGETA